MGRERAPQRDGRTLIKEDAQIVSGGDRQAATRMAEDSVDLITSHAGKPLEELAHRGTPFEVFKKGANRHASGSKDPFATDLVRDPLDRGTLRPIEHC